MQGGPEAAAIYRGTQRINAGHQAVDQQQRPYISPTKCHGYHQPLVRGDLLRASAPKPTLPIEEHTSALPSMPREVHWRPDLSASTPLTENPLASHRQS